MDAVKPGIVPPLGDTSGSQPSSPLQGRRSEVDAYVSQYLGIPAAQVAQAAQKVSQQAGTSQSHANFVGALAVELGVNANTLQQVFERVAQQVHRHAHYHHIPPLLVAPTGSSTTSVRTHQRPATTSNHPTDTTHLDVTIS